MLRYKIGDLIEAAEANEVGVIAHCCNCQVNMGSGIAPQIRLAFPYAWEADQQTEKGDPKKLGSFSFGDPSDEGYDGPLVYNLYGQLGYGKRRYGGRDLNYNALYDALAAMGNHLHGYDTGGEPAHVIGLPMLGAGLAGGDWDIIEMMIKKTLVASGHEVVIYKLKGGPK